MLVRQPLPRQFIVQFDDLLGRCVDPRAERAVVAPCVEEEAAPAAADVDERLAGLELHLPAHVVHLVALRLLECARAFLPVRAGVHHADPVEPRRVERPAEAVMGARIGLGLRYRAVGEPELVPAIANRQQRIRRPGKPHVQRNAKRQRNVALEIHVAVEIRLEYPDVPVAQQAAFTSMRAKQDRESRRRLAMSDIRRRWRRRFGWGWPFPASTARADAACCPTPAAAKPRLGLTDGSATDSCCCSAEIDVAR